MLPNHSSALLRRDRKDKDSASKPERSTHAPLTSQGFTGSRILPSGWVSAHMRTMYICYGHAQRVLCLLFIFYASASSP